MKTASLKTMNLTILRARVTKTLAFMSQILSQNLSTLHNNQPIASSFSPSNSEDLSSSYTSESTDGSVYSNSPITLGLFRRDTNGTLQHKVVIKNVQKKAATTLQRFVRRCLRRKRAHLRRWAILCLQTYIRRRQACQKVQRIKHVQSVRSGVSEIFSNKNYS